MHVKTTTLLLFFLWLVKLFEKLVNNSIVDHLAKWDFFTSSMVLGLLDQLQILLQLYLFLHKLSLMEFQVTYLALFLLFSVMDGFQWFWMGSLHKNIKLILEFFKAPFLVLRFYNSTLMTFLMMLSTILLYMLMILLSVLSVIRHLICGKN